MSFRLLGSAAAVALFAATPALANTPAVTFTGGGTSNFQLGGTEFPLTIGWSFTTSQAFTITGLGFWDQGDDGLLANHRVGIWDNASGNLLVDATVAAGTGASLIDGFRYTSIADYALGAGSYTIGALIPNDLVNNDNWRFGPSTVTAMTGLTFGQGFRGTDMGGFMRPTLSPISGRFGPNFLAAGAVPEPATWAMMIAGFGLVGAGMRRHVGKVRFAAV